MRESHFENSFPFSLLDLNLDISISDFTLFLEKKEWIMHFLSCKIKKMIMYNTKMQQFHNGDFLFENILVNVMIIKKIQQ